MEERKRSVDFLTDTTFLIGRWRRNDGPEQRFIQNHSDAVIALPWIVKAEFLRGAIISGHETRPVKGFLDRYRVVWPDDETLVEYARIYADLHRGNKMIGPHDLWIAASGLRWKKPILTANAGEFSRVSGLKVMDYTDG